MNTYKGRPIQHQNGYPVVSWANHPLSMRGGRVYVHRAVTYEHYGDTVIGMHVHHTDHDKDNFDISNLELLSPSKHSSIHKAAVPILRICAYSECTNVVAITTKRQRHRNACCSSDCGEKYTSGTLTRINWPTRQTVIDMVRKFGYVGTGRRLGVSDNGVRKFLKRTAG